MTPANMAEEDPPPPPSAASERRRRSAATDRLVRLATLLGTYSLGAPTLDGPASENHGNDEEENAQNAGRDAVARCSKSALRALLSPAGGHDGPSFFPSLLIDSDPHHHHHHHHAHAHSEDRSEVEALALANLARPIVLVSRVTSVSTEEKKEPCAVLHNNSEDVEAFGTTRDSDSRGRSTDQSEQCADGAAATANSAVDFTHVQPVSDTNIQNINDIKEVVKAGDVGGDCATDTALACVDDPASIPPLLLRNLSSSFALLVDARLRAYGKILAGHAASLEGDGRDPAFAPDDCDDSDEDECEEGCSCHVGASCVQAAARKLSALTGIGAGLGVDGMVTAMRAQRPDEEGDTLFFDGDRRIVGLPLTFEVVADVGVPNPAEGVRDVMSVSIEAPGRIEGHFRYGASPDAKEARLVSVSVELDTHALLASMIGRACEVVAKAVENCASAAASSAFDRSDEVREEGVPAPEEESRGKIEEGSASGADVDRDRADMPPPKPRTPSLVSPDLCATPAKRRLDERDPAPLDLDGVAEERGDGRISSEEAEDDEERCAAIVDYIMEEVEVPSWLQSRPPCKRARRRSSNGLGGMSRAAATHAQA